MTPSMTPRRTLRFLLLFALVGLLCCCNGCGVLFLSAERSEQLDDQATFAVRAARQARADALDADGRLHAMDSTAAYFADLQDATGWFRPVYLAPTYEHLLQRISLASAEALHRARAGQLSTDGSTAVLGHQAMFLLLLQDARDGRAGTESQAYLADLQARLDQPPAAQPTPAEVTP